MTGRQTIRMWISAIVLFAVVTAPCFSAVDVDDTQEAFFTLRYERIIKTTIIALFTQDSIYIPITQVFSLAKINHELDNDSKTLQGVFSRRMIKYSINAATLTAYFDGREILLDSSDIIVRDLDWYVLPHVLQKIFGIEVKVEFKDLRITLLSKEKLPILLEREREAARQTALAQGGDDFLIGPLMTPREHNLLDGGIVEYNLSVQATDNFTSKEQNRSYTYGLITGLQLLGGDIEIRTNGNYNEQRRTHIWQNTVDWRYVPDENDFMRQIHLGNLGSSGMLGRNFDGITISNTKLQRDEIFNILQIDEYTEPLWEVELRQSGEVINVARADSSGHFHFALPLRYGQTAYELWTYGPTGEQHVEQYQIQVPANFIAPKEINYSLSAGRDKYFKSLLLSGAISTGVTDWLTSKIGVDYVATPTNNRPLVYGALLARLGYNYILNFDIAPTALYRVSLGAIYGSGLNYTLRYTTYGDHPLISSRRLRESISAEFHPPAFNLPFNLALYGTRDRYDNYTYYSVRGGLNFHLYGLQSTFAYNSTIQMSHSQASVGQFQHGITGNFAMRLWVLPSVLGLLLDNTTLRYSTFYNINRSVFTYATAGISRRIFTNGVLNMSVTRDFMTKRTSYNASINIQMPFARSSGHAYMDNNSRSYSQDIRGTMAFDSEAGKFMFTNGSLTGGLAKLRFFNDSNGNNIYDTDEQVLHAEQVEFSERGSVERTTNGEIRLSQVPAYSRIGVDLTEKSVRNPLYIPSVKKFSFIAAPRSVTTINIPFFVAGIVDGIVQWQGYATQSIGIGGIKVQIDGITDSTYHQTLITFSDGSFNFIGIPPGEYTAAIDPQHLRLLKASSTPTKRQFIVQPTQDGDFIQGVNFDLMKLENSAPTGPTSHIPR